MWWWNDYYWHMPWMFGPLVMLFFMALCIGMLFLMMRGRHGGRSSYPLDILKERFAIASLASRWRRKRITKSFQIG